MDDRYRSALHYAADCNHAHIVRQLLIAGANAHLQPPPDVQQQDRYVTPFQLVCADGLDVLVQVFLQYGAGETVNLLDGGRALAERNGHRKIVSMIDTFRQLGPSGKFMGLGPKPYFSFMEFTSSRSQIRRQASEISWQPFGRTERYVDSNEAPVPFEQSERL